MQNPIHFAPSNSSHTSLLPENVAPRVIDQDSDTTPGPAKVTGNAKPEASTFDQSLSAFGEMLDEHKGKLAIGAAAMLGLMVYYKWGEKSLAKEDPEEYQRLQRIKNKVRHADLGGTDVDKTSDPAMIETKG